MLIHRNENGNFHREGGPAIEVAGVKQYLMNGKLHRPDGPAVITRYGGESYYWKGVHVEKTVWHRIPQMTPQEILTEDNVEMRRTLSEIYGLDKLAEKAGTVIHEDKKRQMALIKVPVDNDEDIVMLKVLDGTELPDGTRKTYHLRVPPDQTECLEAVSWTFDCTSAQYKELEVET